MGEINHDRVERIFIEAIDLGPPARTAYLDDACGADEAIKAHVRKLIEAHEAAESIALAPGDPHPATLPGPDPIEGIVGRQIGRYTVRRVIAAGGMGVVCEAVQEKPRRTVALKIMRSGIASASSLRRFEYESQILARLRHPNIAQVYEAGTHDDGTGSVPYFAMEYIPNAKTLIEYARDKRLDVRQRLDLFTKVCGAVSHGHQKGIIHRDLKPGNILVESSGEPKVIDFGVARATDSDMALTTLQTDVGQLIGTLQYMSPEQCEADPHDLDSRSDVYALGVVLFELLCDQLPYDVSKMAVYEAARVIREESPARPSTINRTLRGDLETIALKALEKDRTRRYQSSSDLAADIDRYLNDEPVVARPASALYQLHKFARRNKAVVGGVTVAFAALLIGTIVATWQSVHAHREAAKAIVIKDFLSDMIGATDFVRARGKVTAVEVLDQAVSGIGESFEGEPAVEAEIRHLLGISYGSMTEYGKSIALLRSAMEIRRDTLGPQHPDTLRSAFFLGQALSWNMQVIEAEEVLRQVIAVRARTLGEEHPDTLTAMVELASVLSKRAEHEEAEQVVRRAIDGLTRVLGEDDELTVTAMDRLAFVLQNTGRWSELEETARHAVEIARRTLGERHWITIQLKMSIGHALNRQGRWAEAEPILREVLEANRSAYGDDDYNTLSYSEYLGSELHKHGKTNEGEPLMRQGVEGFRRVLGPRNLSTAYAERRLSTLVWDLGKHEEAIKLRRQAQEVLREHLGETHPHTLDNMTTLARWLEDSGPGKRSEAESQLREIMAIVRREHGEDSTASLEATNTLAWFLKDDPDKLADAEDLAREATSLVRSARGNDDQLTVMIADTLAVVLHLQGKPQDALLEFEQVAAGARKMAGADRWFRAMSTVHYGRCLLELQRFEEAEAVLLSAYGVNDEWAREALLDLYVAWGKPQKASEYRPKVGQKGDEAVPIESGQAP